MNRRVALILSKRDVEILSMLSLRVRAATLSQIARTWWGAAPARTDVCKRRLMQLESVRLLSRMHVNSIPLGPLAAPLAQWSPSEWTPDFGAIAWKLQCRWQAPAVPTILYLATPHCARRFGGQRTDRLPHGFQTSHDLGVTEMFLAVRRRSPAAARLWIDEDRLAPTCRSEKLPDAVLTRTRHSLPNLVLEFGGQYPKSRLQNFHDDCESRGLPYQIW